MPLQLASLVGLVFTLFGMGVLPCCRAEYIVHGGSVPGFPFLASIISLFAGAQLFALGIIGEYLARMHFRMMQNVRMWFVSTRSPEWKPALSHRDINGEGKPSREPNAAKT